MRTLCPRCGYLVDVVALGNGQYRVEVHTDMQMALCRYTGKTVDHLSGPGEGVLP